MFTLTHDHLGRTIALSPHAFIVETMVRASREGWTEIPDVGYGYSQEYAPGTPVHGYALALHRAAEGRRVDYVYLSSAWDAETGRPVEGFLRARELNQVVANTPSFGYTATPETSPVRFSG